MRARSLVLILFTASSILGCAYTHLYGEAMRGVDLGARRRMHVVRHEKDKQELDRTIAERLTKLGFEATYGPEAMPAPEGAQAIVSYEDHWMWDITMYVLVLRIDFRDPQTHELLASGQSYRTSMARKDPDFMIDEIITEIFSGTDR